MKTTPHMKLRKVSHFGTEYRKTPLPADKKGPVKEVQQSTRRRKEVTKRLEYQPHASKSTRHRHCRAKLRVYRDDHPSRPLPANPTKTTEPQYEDSPTRLRTSWNQSQLPIQQQHPAATAAATAAPLNCPPPIACSRPFHFSGYIRF